MTAMEAAASLMSVLRKATNSGPWPMVTATKEHLLRIVPLQEPLLSPQLLRGFDGGLFYHSPQQQRRQLLVFALLTPQLQLAQRSATCKTVRQEYLLTSLHVRGLERLCFSCGGATLTALSFATATDSTSIFQSLTF